MPGHYGRINPGEIDPNEIFALGNPIPNYVPSSSPYGNLNTQTQAAPSTGGGGGGGGNWWEDAIGRGPEGGLGLGMGALGSAMGGRGDTRKGRRNTDRSRIAAEMNFNPFGNTADAAKFDFQKARMADFGAAGTIDPHTWNMLGSTRPDIPGLTSDYMIPEYEDEGAPFWEKLLKSVLGIGSKLLTGGGG